MIQDQLGLIQIYFYNLAMNARRYVICDIEATGLDEERDLIEIALITYQNDEVVEVWETLINPERPVPESIHQLTSISKRELAEAPRFYDVAEAIRLRLEGSVFVSHNTDFDLGLLKKKFTLMGQELKVKSFCTLKVAQHEIPGLKNYNLDALCSFFHIKIRQRHRAYGDALATLELFKELLDLRMKVHPKAMYLPHHEKSLNDIPARAGLLQFKDSQGKVFLMEAAFDMQKRARELLVIKEENRHRLLNTEIIESEVTGSALIAEFKKLLFYPYRPHWMIMVLELDSGEKFFKVAPYKKNKIGLWYYRDYLDARKKLKELERCLKGETFIYREGGKSKEEIFKQNKKVEDLSKDARFPAENLVMVGEGRSAGEKSLILIRNGHVLGYGYTDLSEEKIYEQPDHFLNRRFFQHLGADLAARKYLRILKNLRHKTEGWRSLAEHDRVSTI